MFKKIFCAFPTIKLSKRNFLLVMHCWELHLDNFKGDLFLHPQIPDFQIVASKTNIVQSLQYINGKLIYSAFRWYINLNKNPYDGFCGPGSQMNI